jgi:hypothetical protein
MGSYDIHKKTKRAPERRKKETLIQKHLQFPVVAKQLSSSGEMLGWQCGAITGTAK